MIHPRREVFDLAEDRPMRPAASNSARAGAMSAVV
jgi:hypothetical protein